MAQIAENENITNEERANAEQEQIIQPVNLQEIGMIQPVQIDKKIEMLQSQYQRHEQQKEQEHKINNQDAQVAKERIHVQQVEDVEKGQVVGQIQVQNVMNNNVQQKINKIEEINQDKKINQIQEHQPTTHIEENKQVDQESKNKKQKEQQLTAHIQQTTAVDTDKLKIDQKQQIAKTVQVQSKEQITFNHKLVIQEEKQVKDQQEEQINKQIQNISQHNEPIDKQIHQGQMLQVQQKQQINNQQYQRPAVDQHSKQLLKEQKVVELVNDDKDIIKHKQIQQVIENNLKTQIHAKIQSNQEKQPTTDVVIQNNIQSQPITNVQNNEIVQAYLQTKQKQNQQIQIFQETNTPEPPQSEEKHSPQIKDNINEIKQAIISQQQVKQAQQLKQKQQKQTSKVQSSHQEIKQVIQQHEVKLIDPIKIDQQIKVQQKQKPVQVLQPAQQITAASPLQQNHDNKLQNANVQTHQPNKQEKHHSQSFIPPVQGQNNQQKPLIEPHKETTTHLIFQHKHDCQEESGKIIHQTLKEDHKNPNNQTSQQQLQQSNQFIEDSKKTAYFLNESKDDISKRSKTQFINYQHEGKSMELPEQTEKQKYRLHSEYVESIPEQKNQGEKQVILFTQFSQPQDQKTPFDKIQVNDANKQVKQQIEEQLATIRVQKETIQPKEIKTIVMIQQEIKQQKKTDQSPKKQGIGKISKRNINQKRVHEIVKDLHKYDEKKTVIPSLLQKPKKTSHRKIDLSKLDTHIGIHSNILNVTIGQILSKTEDEDKKKLLGEVNELKNKLIQLQRKKQERDDRERDQKLNQIYAQEEMSPKLGESNFKSHKKQLTGRIYRKHQNNSSLLSQQFQITNKNQNKNLTSIQLASVSSAPRNRFASTGFPQSKTNQKESDIEFNKTMGINFRVRKPSKSNHGVSEFQSGQKDPGFIKGKQKFEEDKCFQVRRQIKFEKLQFTEEQKLNFLERPTPRELNFTPNFREQVEKYFIDLKNQAPKGDWSQEQLVDLAKNTFKIFGVNLQLQKSLTLSVKKYKNCVSFILDSDRTILWYYEGKFYYGGWILNKIGQGQKINWGYEYAPSKYVYSGNYKQNKRDGYGVIKFLSKDSDIIYEGNWCNGLKQGFGKQIDGDQIQYLGEWQQGKKHGEGKLKISEKQQFSGQFLYGIKNGEGSQIFKNGDTYNGNYIDGKFNGQGTYTWANLSRYQGEFKDGARNGNGVWVANYLDENTDRYEGDYRNDKKNGYGVYKWKDGTSYAGEFVNDLKHGQGTVSYGDGRTAKLQWIEGVVAPRPGSEKSASGIKRSRANSQKSDNIPIALKKASQSKSRPTRISQGLQKI